MGLIESYCFEKYTATILGSTIIGLKSFDHDRSASVEVHYGKGNMPTGWGRKKTEASGKLEVSLEEYEKIVKAAAAFNNDPLKLPPFPITGIFKKSNGKTYKEVAPAVLIEKIGHKRKIDDTEINVDLDLKLLLPVQEFAL